MLRKSIDFKILENYGKRLNDIKNWYQLNDIFNIYQKRRLDIFIDRSINYCQTKKRIKYEKFEYHRSNLHIASKQQIIEYRKLYQMLIKLKLDIINDNLITSKCKKDMIMNLTYIIGHVRGKLNTKVGK